MSFQEKEKPVIENEWKQPVWQKMLGKSDSKGKMAQKAEGLKRWRRSKGSKEYEGYGCKNKRGVKKLRVVEENVVASTSPSN